MSVGPEYAYGLNNFITRPFGLEVRKGYAEWLPYGYAFTAPVRTLIPYQSPGNLNNKLFACLGDSTSTVYDISTPNTTPTVALTPGGGANVAGEWSYTNYNTPSKQYICAVLWGKGYYTYDGSAWTLVPVKMTTGQPAAGEIKFEYNGVTYQSSTMLFTFSWKNRLWFIQADTGLAWYLPVNQVTGVATAFDLGQFLKHGGGLAFAVNWTYDSGDGIDDNLVFVGNNGDMVIYQGTDPAQAATFRLAGTWYIGRVPVGRRGWCQYGGDVLVVTEYGIMSVSDFVSGRITNPMNQSQIGGKYNTSLARYISNHINDKYWQLFPYPTEETIILLSPAIEPATSISICFAVTHFTKAWSSLTNFPAHCAVLYQGGMIFGTAGGKVYQGFKGYRDGDSYDGVHTGAEVTGIFQTAFFDFGSPSANKRAQRVKLLGRSDGLPGFIAVIRDEYNIENPPSVPSPPFRSTSLWDIALWDNDLWQSRATTFGKWFGVAGFGKKLSTQVAIRSLGYTLVTDYEVTYEEGIGL
jgi:hypothetical protein